jgi:uncharacterized membrane protein
VTTLQLALLGHLIGAFLFVSGIVVAGVAFEAARRRREPAEIALLLGLTRIGVALVGLGALAVLGFGIWLVHLEGLGHGVRWIREALGLFVVVAVLGALGGRKPKLARRHAEELAHAGRDADDELRRLLDDRVARGLNYASGALTLAIVVLMVWKPT